MENGYLTLAVKKWGCPGKQYQVRTERDTLSPAWFGSAEEVADYIAGLPRANGKCYLVKPVNLSRADQVSIKSRLDQDFFWGEGRSGACSPHELDGIAKKAREIRNYGEIAKDKKEFYAMITNLRKTKARYVEKVKEIEGKIIKLKKNQLSKMSISKNLF